MNSLAFIWSDPRFVYAIAFVAILLLFVTVWLFRRPKRAGRQAGIICLMLSIFAHLALLLLVPMLSKPDGGSATIDPNADQVGSDTVTFSTFNDMVEPADTAGLNEAAVVAPLPVTEVEQLVAEPMVSNLLPPSVQVRAAEIEPEPAAVPESLSMNGDFSDDVMSDLDDALGDLMDSPSETPDSAASLAMPTMPATEDILLPDMGTRVGDLDPTFDAQPASSSMAPPAFVVGAVPDDFANRVGSAKELALNQTGGSRQSEAAVESALNYLVDHQSADGSWRSAATNGGVERSPMGENRGGAGKNADTAITGLALLALLGAGNSHEKGPHADSVYRGLSYLIKIQEPDGSLAGRSSIYASTYSHGIASLAMCEAAAITGDESAMDAARRAIKFTTKMQHPSTGGWRYTPGDPGDMSQLGWQAMVLDAGHRANIKIDRRSIFGVQKFMRSVRAGSGGGLASYRPGEASSRTMTAEALSTRLLVGDKVPPEEVEEAERYMLQQLPGSGQDNYYYWYYATLAMHQLQDDSWKTWNEALQNRLFTTQRHDGSWPTTSVWGGYGGNIYSTAMGALCLESYYRHSLRKDTARIAETDGNPLR